MGQGRGARGRRGLSALLATLALLAGGCGGEGGAQTTTTTTTSTVTTDLSFDSVVVSCEQWDDAGGCSTFAYSYLPCATCTTSYRTTFAVDPNGAWVQEEHLDSAYVDDLLSDIRNPAFDVQLDEQLLRQMDESALVAGQLDEVVRAAGSGGFSCRRVGRVPFCW